MKKKEFVAQDLLTKIYQNLYKDYKLPTERELALKYNVSRHTIREALKKLNNIGIIEIIQGSGIFINRKFHQSPLIYNSITEKKYNQIKSKIIYFVPKKPGKEEKQIFDLKEDELLWEFQRVRIVDYKITQIEISKLPVHLFRDLEKKNIESSIQKYVRDKNLEISHYITTYEAVSINREQAELLKCKKGTPAMKILNRGILENGMVYEYSEIIDIDYSCTYFIPFNKQNHSFRQLVP